MACYALGGAEPSRGRGSLAGAEGGPSVAKPAAASGARFVGWCGLGELPALRLTGTNLDGQRAEGRSS
jgi:hypothetical protein